MSRFYVTTAIPRLNARPDLGFALEVVRADVLARHHSLHGDRVRFLTGTDDNSLAAEGLPGNGAEGLPAGRSVDDNAAAFAGLRDPLALSFNDFIRTSLDARHQSGVERLWRACVRAGDIYRDERWFFRLSGHAGRLRELISSGELRIEPVDRRNEVLDLIAAGLPDIDVSHPHGRGIPVPGDPDQVIHGWWDALGSYITSLGYGTDGPNHRRWWLDSNRRVHVVGEDVFRPHAVYWPAVLLSAGEPLPTDVLVCDNHTATADVTDLVTRYGADAVRWWLLRDGPEAGFPVAGLVARANEDLAFGLGKLVDRIVVMVHRYRDGEPPVAEPATGAERLVAACGRAPEDVHDALTAFDFRRATAAVWRIVEEANRYLNLARPWELAGTQRGSDSEAGRQLDAILAVLLAACRTLANQLLPFVPTLAARIAEQCFALSGSLALPRVLYPRLRSGGR
jgi:methionyl-tRNA synthetase